MEPASREATAGQDLDDGLMLDLFVQILARLRPPLDGEEHRVLDTTALNRLNAVLGERDDVDDVSNSSDGDVLLRGFVNAYVSRSFEPWWLMRRVSETEKRYKDRLRDMYRFFSEDKTVVELKKLSVESVLRFILKRTLLKSSSQRFRREK